MTITELLILTRPFILFDFETTHFEDKNRAVSLGLKRYHPDGKVDIYKTLINPECAIAPDTTAIHKIDDYVISNGCAKCWKNFDQHPNPDCTDFKPIPTFGVIAPSLARGFSDCDYAGQNVQYDIDVMISEMARVGQPFDPSKALIIDTLRVEATLEPRNLGHLYRKYTGRELEGAHDAMIDVEATETVLLGQFAHPNAHVLPRGIESLARVLNPPRQRRPDWIDADGKFVWVGEEPCVNVNPWKGQPMRRAQAALRWMLKKSFSDEVKKICSDALAGRYPTKQQSLQALGEGGAGEHALGSQEAAVASEPGGSVSPRDTCPAPEGRTEEM